MKTKIFKYPFAEADGETSSTILLPVGAQVLSFGCQKDRIYLWALVDPEEKTHPHRYAVFGTGWDMSALDPPAGHRFEFRATVHMHGELFVWHIFEILPEA